MSKQGTRYDEEFKRTLVDLYHNGKTPVSYTHLDVYKRQQSGNPAFCTGFLPGMYRSRQIRCS